MKKKGEKTKEKIIQHAIDLFYQHGYTKASTRLLVKSAGMTSSAIYNHFANKDEILFTIIQQTADQIMHDMQKIIKQYEDPVDCLKYMITDMLQYVNHSKMRKEIAILIDELYHLPGELRERSIERHREIFRIFRGVIRQIQKRYSPNPMDDTAATFFTLGAIQWIKYWYKDDGRLSITQISDDLIKFVLQGMTGGDDVGLKS
jgi:AcrR family transcriptional regulator